MNAVTRAERALLESPTVNFTLDGQAVRGRADESILQIAQRHGAQIPHLCFSEGLEPAGNCRVCMVEVQGERVLAASCCRQASNGMQVHSRSARALKSQ